MTHPGGLQLEEDLPCASLFRHAVVLNSFYMLSNVPGTTDTKES